MGKLFLTHVFEKGNNVNQKKMARYNLKCVVNKKEWSFYEERGAACKLIL